MRKLIALTALLLAAALPAFAQKGPDMELGFQPGKLYDFTEIDTVNLFNGNLMITVPIGPRKQVSSSLSYRMELIYNGKVWDYESVEGCYPSPTGAPYCAESLPNRRSNAGLGWRLNFGRLLPPSDPSVIPRTTSTRDAFVYEGPDGDEHGFYGGGGTALMAMDASSLRLIAVPPALPSESKESYIVEFPTGERHRFDWENGAYRLKRIFDRFDGWVSFKYTYDLANDKRRVLTQTITDSTGSEHFIKYEVREDLNESVDRGAIIDYIDYMGFGGKKVEYDFKYTDMSVRLRIGADRILVPMLTTLEQPDGSAFTFSYYSDPNGDSKARLGAMEKLTLPTGGSTEYDYQDYYTPSKLTCAEWTNDSGILSRKVSDGPLSVRQWDYVHEGGYEAPVEFPDREGNYCCISTWWSSTANPVYWFRTVVLSPEETVGGKKVRTRTDHYFDTYSFDFFFDTSFGECPPKAPLEPPRVVDPWQVEGRVAYGYPGTVAAPEQKVRQGPLGPVARDDIYVADDDGRRLTTETYSGCTTDGDCTNGKLERSTWTKYENHPLSTNDSPYALVYGADISQQLQSTKTVYHESDDAGCDGDCFIAVDYFDNNGTGIYGKSVRTSNFPGAKTKTTTTLYDPWTRAKAHDKASVWITNLYTERKVEQGTETRRKLFCFDKTNGFLERTRVLADSAEAGASDVLTVFEPTSHGDVAFEKNYGGDKQNTMPTPHDCESSISGQPWYQIETSYNTPVANSSLTPYTGGIPVWQKYYDREDGTELPFKALDRWIDIYTGAVIKDKDTAGVTTTYGYEASPVRLKSVTPTGGTKSTYDYENATASVNAHVIETVTSGSSVIATNTYEYDGLGRVKRVSKTLPNGKVAIVQNDYDDLGRLGSVTQPIEADEHSFSDVSGPGASFTYDAFGRKKSVRAADGATTSFVYSGIRRTERTKSVATSLDITQEAVTVTELYDDQGRLDSVKEPSGPGGVDVVTDYTYNIEGALVEASTTSAGVTQTRKFEYDQRGFMDRESHPEIQDPDTPGTEYTDYSDYDARGHAWKRTVGGVTTEYTFDSIERITEVSVPSGLIKKFEFGESGNANGKLEKAKRYNRLPSMPNEIIEVTETYSYGANGLVDSRTTLVERATYDAQDNRTATTLQEFDYGTTYDEFLMPKTIRMPRCRYSACVLDDALTSVTNERTAGALTEVKSFAKLTYHPSGMVHKVEHEAIDKPTDEYDASNGLPRPSRITFTGCATTKPYFLPGFVRAKVDPNACGIQVTWPAAALCGGSSSIKYRVLRNGQTISGCVTGTKYVDTTAARGQTYTYTIVAVGPRADGTFDESCATGDTETLDGRPFKFESCDSATTLVADDVWASVGQKARFAATLTSPNGPIVDETLTFSLLGNPIATVKTGPNGVAAFDYDVDLDPAKHKDGVTVTYDGGLFQMDTDTADITIICDFKSYSVFPGFLNVGKDGGLFEINVNTSDKCGWYPSDPRGFLAGRVTPLTPAKKGFDAFKVDVPLFDGSGQRSDDVWVNFDYNTKRIPVEQGSGCTFRFTPSPVYIPYRFTFDGSINVSAPADCAWTVTDNADWLDLIESTATGKGNGIVSFRADQNSGKQRAAKLSINGGEEVAWVNQDPPPEMVCPTMVRNLIDGGSVRNGQNVSLRVYVEGTYLTYKWYANGRKIRDCDDEDCSALTLGPGDEGYPDEGESVTYVVTVENLCDGVESNPVTFHNFGSNCRVPTITNSFPWGANQAPEDQLVFGHSSEIRMSAMVWDQGITWQWYSGRAGDERDPVSDEDGGKTDTIKVRAQALQWFWVKATNSCGSQISRNAAVYLYRQPRLRRRAVSKSFNGDAVADLLWQNKVTGQNEIWTMGTEGEHVGTIALSSNPNPDMQLQSVGDIDDSERPDLIWRDPKTGKNEVWLMSGSSPYRTEPIETREDGRWTIGGVADLDDDYNDDVIWHNNITGENEIWFMDGSGRQGTWALPSNVGSGWGLHGADDFTGDGRPDLFFHNRNTGENSIWQMNDARPGYQIGPQSDTAGGAPTRMLEATVVPMASMPDTNWVPAMIGNFDGDVYARPDIVWRNVVTGENRVWIMEGPYVSKTVELEKRADLDWQIGGGGSTNAGTPGGGGTDPRTATSISAVANPARVGTGVAVTATLTAAGTPLANKEIVFALNGADFARLRTDATGMVEAARSVAGIAAGTYPNAITVRFDGDTTHNASTASANLVITAAPATVTWTNPAPIVYGTPLSAAQLNATADVPGAFVYNPPAGTVLNAGYATLSVTFTPADTTLAPVTKLAVLVVTKAASSVTWAKPESITYGMPLSDIQLNAMSGLAGEFTYDPEPGTVLPVGSAQTLRVTFVPESPNYETSTGTTTIDVTKGQQIIRWSDPATMQFGDPLTGAQLNAAVITSGSAPAGAMTYAPPIGTLLPEGTHELKVSVAETEFYEAASAAVDVVVSRSSALITWNNPAPIVYGTPLSATQLNATSNLAGTFEYTPKPGTVLSAGTEKLAVVFTPADPRYTPATAFVVIEVTKATPVAAWSAPPPIVYGTPLSTTQLNATANILGEFVYTPKAGAVLDAGRHELTARLVPGDIRNYESVTLTVTLDVAKAEQTITWPQPAPIVYGTPLSATQLNATVAVAGPSPAGAATYSPAAGTILQAGTGQVLSVSVDATPNYNSASKTVTLDVLKATPVLTWPQPAPIIYKTLLSSTQLNATSNVQGSFSYSPAAGTLLEAGLHTLTANFTPSDTRNYNDASTTVTLEVQKADPVLAWSEPSGIVYGTALSATQLNATADVPGTFVYSPDGGTILNAGNGQTLSAHFTPSDSRNYNEGDVSTTIDVAKAPQSIVWASPAPIVYGTPLSATQLNATVEVVGPAAHGSRTYTPPAGTVLDAGLGQTLSVAVAETSNYLPAAKSVMLDVLRAPLSLVVDAKSKLYGDPVPALTGTLTGVVNNDPITPAYATIATQASVTGTYPITGTLVDPNNRLVNYDVTITPSTLTVNPAPLTIAAVPASKQYSDPMPKLTATFTGLVLGETPAVLSGILSIQTTAERLSAPGAYPITIGGLSSTNYAITYVGSTFTVTQEDARVLNTSPPFIGGARSGPTTVTLAATVRDVTVTPDANGDVDAGDIRNATLTFVDRSTNSVLCTAPIGLLVASDERTGVATCSFTRDFSAALPASLTVGARVAGYYARDAAADDLAMTIDAPTEDTLNGGGKVEVASTAGTYAPQLATSLQYNVNLQYDKNAVLKGKLTFAFTRTEAGATRAYELTAVPASLSIRRTAEGGRATIIGTATLRDVTVPTAPVVIADGAPFVVTATDAGEPSPNDAVSVLLLKREGGLWLATGWDGLRAVEQPVRQGNVQVLRKK